MKLVIAIVQSDDSGGLLDALRDENFSATMVSSTGGFLREGNATIYAGVQDDQVEKVLELIKENCTTRTQLVNPLPPVMEPGELYLAQPVEVQVGGATVFVLEVARFEKF
ncbi:MAG: cyclic-di-AMP receptor [Chloroflexi bacterium]|nr:cyclic-di-AMP receptor [Chloroflexota bacterium]MBI3742209.1 cyclic-di-AMP receptor [Chloroflexota bacterium]